MKAFKKNCRRVLSAILAAAMVIGLVPATETKAANGSLTSVESAAASANIVTVKFNNGIRGKITFLEGDIFRYNVDPSGAFSEYATTVYGNTVKIPQYPDSYDAYSHPSASVSEAGGYIVIEAGDTTIKFEKATAKMSVAYKGDVVMEEKEAPAAMAPHLLRNPAAESLTASPVRRKAALRTPPRPMMHPASHPTMPRRTDR